MTIHRLLAVACLCLGATVCSAEAGFPWGSSWHWLPGTGEPSAPDPTAWRQTAAAVADPWPVGLAPFHFGKASTGTPLSDMPGNYSSIFLRRVLVLTNATSVQSLALTVVADDGCVVWLNGQEIGRVRVPGGDPARTTLASIPAAEPVPAEAIEVAKPWEWLTDGTNLIAIQALNVSVDDADFLIDASLTLTHDSAAPVVADLTPAPGTIVPELDSLEVAFDEPVLGLAADDLLINGLAATGVVQVLPDRFVFHFPPQPDGPVEVRWRDEHGITDTGGLANRFAGGTWTYTVDSRAASLNVWINEFVADNQRTLNDEDGEGSDWIELYNAGSDAVGLLGWGLSDVATNGFQWRFPDVTIEPEGYLVVFASGKDRTDVTARLHTNFKLNAAGEFLALTAPDGTVTSEFAPAYPPQRTDVSFGRVPADPTRLGFFPSPTPGARNSVSGDGFAPDVVFSRASACFVEPFDLVLSAPAQPGAQIRYSLDGSLPGQTSLVYTAALTITNTTRVRARAFVPDSNLFPGPPRSAAYTRVATNLTGFTSDLPLLILNSWSSAISSSRNTPVTFELHEPRDGLATLTNRVSFAARGGAKIRGSSTAGLPKASYAIEWWDDFNQDLELGILGMPPDSEWVLYAPNSFDPVLIHNPFVHQLSRDLGQYSPRTRFVEVFLNRGGILSSNHYVGLYVLMEKISLGRDRVNTPRLEPENQLTPQVTGGYLLKADRLDPGDSGLSAGGATFALVDPKERILKSAARRPQLLYLTGYLNAFNQALASSTFRDPVLGYRPYINTAHWIDYHIVEVLSGNVDAMVLSSYFYKPREGPLCYGVHWDFDRALGSTDGRDANPRVWQTGPFFSGPWWNRVCADANFWQAWVDRYQALRNEELGLPQVHGLIDRLANEVRQAQPRDRKRWNVALRGGSYQGEVNLMKNWVSNRLEFIDRQLAQPPRFSEAGGPVLPGFALTLDMPEAPRTNSPAAAIYYTLDGTDPRGETNSLAAGARLYAGAITITNDVRVVARVRDPARRQSGGPPSSTPWSRPVAATYTVHPPALRLTELQFNPGVLAGDTYDPDDYEFLELLNASAESLSLLDYHFVNGIRYRFTTTSPVTHLEPGGRVIVVAHLAAFQSRYPDVANAVGPWEGGLADSGERLTLLGPLEEVVFDFTYQGLGQPMSSGGGFSLVLRDEALPAYALGDAASWRVSSRAGGSPGTADAAPPPRPPVLVNEVRSRSAGLGDAVELFNASPTQAADISGWWLSDSWIAPRQYRFPPHTVIPPEGFLVVPESAFGADASVGFDLTGVGTDSIWLFSADDTATLTGYAHGFDFGAAEIGVSFGRVQTSDGREHFAPQTQVTLGGPNASPKAGPVMISELQVHLPERGALNNTPDEFIELCNSAAVPVALFDSTALTNTWRLRGGLEYEFPPGVTLAPGERVLVVGFDPQGSPWARVAFDAKWFTPPDVRLFGPWRGMLNQLDDTVRIQRPDTPLDALPDMAPVVPFILVDELHYRNDGSWPIAHTDSRLSLTRILPAGYGNEPASWIANLSSPGDGDTDLDGLPDRWELATGLDPISASDLQGAEGDPDGDGFTNQEEYLAGTDPGSAASQLRLELGRGADGKPWLSIEAAPHRSYTVLFRDNLGSIGWQVLGTQQAPFDGGILRFSDSAVIRSNRFYLLRTP